MRRLLILIIIMSVPVPALCHDESALETRYAFEALLLAVFAFMVLLYTHTSVGRTSGKRGMPKEWKATSGN